MRWIYISPHLDDAVLSCGGLIREQTSTKTQVEIWTVFSGDPPAGSLSAFANFQHTQWGLGVEASSLRRARGCHCMPNRWRQIPPFTIPGLHLPSIQRWKLAVSQRRIHLW